MSKDKDKDKIPKGSISTAVLHPKDAMTIDRAVAEWQSRARRMGCVAATGWFIKRVPGFRAERLTRYTERGEVFEHVVATNGIVRIDLAPYADMQRESGE